MGRSEVETCLVNYIFDKPWITTGLALSCKIKNKLHNKWIKARGTTTEHVKKIEYKNYSSKLRNLIRASEIHYFGKINEYTH